MEDFASILVRDYGLKPQGKSAPMSSTKVSPGVGSSRGSGYGSDRKSVSGRMSGNASTFGGQDDVPYLSRKNGSTKSSGRSAYGGGAEEIFHPGNYDDVFGGPPKSSSAGPRYDDVFGETPDVVRAPVYDDLFGGLGVNEAKGKYSSSSGLSPRALSPRRPAFASEPSGFDELLPGFSSEPAKSRSSDDVKVSHDEDPFVPPLIDDPVSTAPSNSSSAPFIDPMDVFTVPPTMPPINTSSTDVPRASSNASGAYDGFDIFDGFTGQSSVDASKPRESSQSSRDDLKKSVEDMNSNHSTGVREQSLTEETEPLERDLPTVDTSEAYNISAKSSPFFSFKSDDGMETPAASGSSSKPVDDGQAGFFASPLDSPVPYKSRSRSSPFGDVKEKWLTVNDVKLVTKPSSVPPPSRPPPMPGSGRYGSGSRPRVDHMESAGQDDRFVSSSWPSANSTASVTYATSSEEEQAGGGTPGGSRKDFFGRADYKTNLANHAGDEEKDGEDDSAGVKAREKERQEKEIRIAREKVREAEAREEREKERARRYKEKEREREKDRAAVQRVTLEARERAAQDARERAERSAVERATAEARERAAHQAQIRAERERAAVERANAEARERAEQRAALEKAAKDRAEQKAAVERAAAEARERAERIAVERAQAEARERAEKAAAERAAAERQRAERAAAEAREREAAERARERSNQQQRKSEHDLDAFFNPGLRTTPPSSEPKQRTPSTNNNSDPNGIRRSVNNSRPSSAPADDFMRLFDDPPPTSNSGEDPNRKRTGAQQRSQQRAAKAIEEIKQRDLEMQREQAEKHRAADQLDAEIRRWAAGKEGNLRALLSTLQYVLWPECGWQPVSLSDLITAASVKKTYRKATLHVHPDKVQQKGATVQQKYIAEKVFDLLKEASNKFNSEELF